MTPCEDPASEDLGDGRWRNTEGHTYQHTGEDCRLLRPDEPETPGSGSGHQHAAPAPSPDGETPDPSEDQPAPSTTAHASDGHTHHETTTTTQPEFTDELAAYLQALEDGQPEPDESPAIDTHHLPQPSGFPPPPARGQPAPEWLGAGSHPENTPAVQAFTDWCFHDFPAQNTPTQSDYPDYPNYTAQWETTVVEDCYQSLRMLAWPLTKALRSPADADCILGRFKQRVQYIHGDDGRRWGEGFYSDSTSERFSWAECPTLVNEVPWSQRTRLQHCEALAASDPAAAAAGMTRAWCESFVAHYAVLNHQPGCDHAWDLGVNYLGIFGGDAPWPWEYSC